MKIKNGLMITLVTVAGTQPVLSIAEQEGDSGGPRLSRIQMVTISSQNPQQSAARYAQYLGYEVIEEGTISPDLARAWGADLLAGKPFVTLSSAGEDMGYVRFVENDDAQLSAPMTAIGWSALELLVQDPYATAINLQTSPFQLLGAPAPIMAGSTIHATQFLGPDGEVLYLTADRGPRATSTLAQSSSPVGRPFIVVLADDPGATAHSKLEGHLSLEAAFSTRIDIPFLAAAQGLPSNHAFPVSLYRLDEFSHSIELDVYPDPQTKGVAEGQLPGAISIVSFCAESSLIEAEASICPPGLVYAGRAMGVIRLNDRALTELIDCDRSLGEKP